MPKALRVTTTFDATSTRGAEKDRLWDRMITMARQHVGVMETYDADVEEAVRRAVRDAFSGGDSGIRVGRRARARFEALRKTMRRRSGGAVSSGLLMRGDADNEDNMRLLDNHRNDASAAVSLPLNDVALLDAFDGEDDIEWGARLSKRKLRRLEASTAMTMTSSRGDDLEMIKYEELDAAVYAVMRSPMTMGALKRIFYETRDRLGDDFKPRTVLDFGSGPIPSTLFAARAVFGEDVGTSTTSNTTKTTTARGKRDAAWNDVKVAFVDSNPGMMRFARRVVGYAEKIAEERRLSEAATTNTATEKLCEGGGDDARRETAVVVEEDEDGIIRLDFSDFETGDARKSSNGVVARESSAIRLKTPHPWHESEGVRTSASLHGANRREGFDMVVSSYALGEIPEGVARVGRSGRVERNQRQLDVTIRQLWDKVAPGGILVIAEPGTPRGSALVRRARALVLEVARRDAEQNARRNGVSPDLSAVEAYVVAPCQHDGACPIKEEHREDGFATWCHFPQRALRSKYAREMNQSARPYQDEKFSYVVLRKQPRAEARRRAARATRRARDARADDDSDDAEESHHESVVRESVEEWSRVIRSPKKRKGHVVVELCTARGEIERAVIAKSHGSDQGIGREGYKFARKLRWGDLWPFTNKTVTKPGDQRRFELEAARFYAEHAARIEAAAEPPRRYIGEPMDAALQAFIDDELDDDDNDLDDDVLDGDDADLDEDILALFQNMSVEDLAALRRRARDPSDPSDPFFTPPPSN